MKTNKKFIKRFKYLETETKNDGKIDKEHKEAKLKIAKCYFSIAHDYKNKGDLDTAIVYFNNATICNPDNYEAWNNVGIAYFNKKEYDKNCTNTAFSFIIKCAAAYVQAQAEF